MERRPLCSEMRGGGFARRTSRLKPRAMWGCLHEVAPPIFQPLVVLLMLDGVSLKVLQEFAL